MKTITYRNLTPERIDKYLSTSENISREVIKKQIISGHILVNDKQVKNSYLLANNDIITILQSNFSPTIPQIFPEGCDLEILYEDSNFTVINKPRNLITYNAYGHYNEPSVASSLKKIYGDNLANPETIKPGIVHRLDFETSGVLVTCKNNTAHAALSKEFAQRKVCKIYLAICQGHFKNLCGTINISLTKRFGKHIKTVAAPWGKEAVTEFEVIAQSKTNSLVKIKLITGRTHQIRAHMACIGHPLVGDKLYGPKQVKNTFLLHAKTITFTCPITQKQISVEAPLDDTFKKELEEYVFF